MSNQTRSVWVVRQEEKVRVYRVLKAPGRPWPFHSNLATIFPSDGDANKFTLFEDYWYGEIMIVSAPVGGRPSQC